MVVLSMIDNVSKISNLMLIGKYCKINVKTRLIYFDIASSSEYQGFQGLGGALWHVRTAHPAHSMQRWPSTLTHSPGDPTWPHIAAGGTLVEDYPININQ